MALLRPAPSRPVVEGLFPGAGWPLGPPVSSSLASSARSTLKISGTRDVSASTAACATIEGVALPLECCPAPASGRTEAMGSHVDQPPECAIARSLRASFPSHAASPSGRQLIGQQLTTCRRRSRPNPRAKDHGAALHEESSVVVHRSRAQSARRFGPAGGGDSSRRPGPPRREDEGPVPAEPGPGSAPMPEHHSTRRNVSPIAARES